MSTFILRDNPDVRANLLPLTFTRPISLLRCGIITLSEKWSSRLNGRYLYDTAEYLNCKFQSPAPDDYKSDDTWIISSHYITDDTLAKYVESLHPGQSLVTPDNDIIATRCSIADEPKPEPVIYESPTRCITQVYHIFGMNGDCIDDDFRLLTAGRSSEPIGEHVTVIGDRSRIFLEAGARIECAVINVKSGPVYIGTGAEIMEGCLIRGGLALCEHSVVHMGAKIYGPTTLGPWCKAGGELNNVVMTGYSNKGHDGFLGNAVLGEWCNLGAGTNASNLKNDYSPVKLWNYPSRRFLPTGLQFCGLIMGDHSKTGINTMLNTGTMFGVGVNFHGSGYPRNFTASFSEGSNAGMSDVPLPRFYTIAERVMARRGVKLTDADKAIFEEIARLAETYK